MDSKPRSNKWDQRLLELARFIAHWSKDPSTKVGCVIVDSKRRVVGLGYNGFPRGVVDLSTRYIDREAKYKFVMHAEANAILNSQQTDGCDMYASLFPCNECAKLIVQSGIRTVLCPEPSEEMLLRWGDSMSIAMEMFKEAGVEVRYVT